ncbi:MAG: M12 family metallopeptidase [Phycisphaerales bacterium]
MVLQACTHVAALLRYATALVALAAAPLAAQVPNASDLPADVAAREELPCNTREPAPPVGKSLWITSLWTGGVVPYVFDANTDSTQQAAMRTAMNALESVANVHFVARTGQANYITVRDSGGNNSQVGMVGGVQTVNIYNWNFTYIMCHELMHALGMHHEQSRPDRDNYVTINYGNVDVDVGQCGGSCAYNFDVVQAAVQGPYDFDSVMHYGQYSFSSNGQTTITVLAPNQSWQTLIGQRTHLSTGDIAGLVSRYGAVPAAPWTQRTVTGPSARDGAAMVYDSFRHVVVLFGGMTASARSAETWEWNGSTWTQRTVTGPSARYQHAMAYDANRHVVVLFGGNTAAGAYNAETWEWNGTAWTQRTGTAPNARNLHAMAFDSNRNVTVLFGGATSSTVRNAETWEWNGTAWTQRSVTGPTGRAGHTLTFDTRRNVTLFTGGQAASSTYPGDTWEWNGSAWSQRTVGGPSARTQQAAAYDPVRAVTALFGGWNGTTVNAENWDWSGTAWVQRTGTSPTARYGHAMAQDTARGVTVLFGGINGTTRNAETWELGTPCAAPTISAHPASQTGCNGNYTATFSVTASSAGAVTYQWRKDSANISDVAGHRSGCTTPTLTITNAASADVGSYSCVVTSLCGSTPSNAAPLAVTNSPTPISLSATPNTICAGAGTSVTLSATAQGAPIRWYDSSTNQAVTSPVSPTVTTSYYAVSNFISCPSNHSQLVTVTVLPAPVAPTSIQVTSGSATYCPASAPASITLQANGGSGGTVSWRKADGTSSTGCGTTAAGTGATLTISPAPTATTTYYASVTGTCGTSACASFTITVGGCLADLAQRAACRAATVCSTTTTSSHSSTTSSTPTRTPTTAAPAASDPATVGSTTTTSSSSSTSSSPAAERAKETTQPAIRAEPRKGPAPCAPEPTPAPIGRGLTAIGSYVAVPTTPSASNQNPYPPSPKFF